MIAGISGLAFSDSVIESFRVGAASASVGVAGAVLSVFVVLRRWAYLGDGIAHAGFGGIGTAVLLAIAFPSLNNGPAIFMIGAGFALATAVAVGWISRRRAVSGDAAVGIFVAAALAWGFIAFSLHNHLGRGGTVVGLSAGQRDANDAGGDGAGGGTVGRDRADRARIAPADRALLF